MKAATAHNQVFVTRIERDSADEDFARLLAVVAPPQLSAARQAAVKINLCDYRLADSGATTDPELLCALVRALRRLSPGLRVTAVENDATSVEADSLFSLLGFREAARREGFELLNAARGEWVARRVPRSQLLSTVEVPLAVAQADVFINFAKLKTNAISKMSCCLKNLFGLLRPKRKSPYHGRLAECIADLNAAMPADLCIVDGLIGVEGLGGPAFGRPKNCGLLVGGRNAVAVDACCARIMGFRPRAINHLRAAARQGLGSLRYRLLTDVEGFRYRDHTFKFSRWQYALRCAMRGSAGIQ